MVAYFGTDDLGQDYPGLLDDLRSAPIIDTRGGRTRELVDFTLVLRDPTRCLVNRVGVSRRFMDAEIAMLLAGEYDAALLRAITPKAADLTTPLTAYGPRVRHQLPIVVQELQGSPLSRRAVVYIGDNDDLGGVGEGTADEMPCTMTWQFLIREDQLTMIVNMRSWDAVWGLTYDVPCFVAVQMAVAKVLDVGLGEYRHHAGSFHLYERHWDIEATPTNGQLDIEWLCDDWLATTLAASCIREVMSLGALKAVAVDV